MVHQDPAKIILAGAVGFALGMLFAPHSGRETRERIRHRAEDVQQRAKNMVQDTKTYMREGRDQLKEAAASTRRRAKESKGERAGETPAESS